MYRAQHASVARIDERRNFPTIFQQIQTSDIRNRINDSGNIPVISDGGKDRFQSFRIRIAEKNLRHITSAQNLMMKRESRFISDREIPSNQQCDRQSSGRIPFPGRMITETFRGFQDFLSHLRTDRSCPIDNIGDSRLGTASLPSYIADCDLLHKKHPEMVSFVQEAASRIPAVIQFGKDAQPSERWIRIFKQSDREPESAFYCSIYCMFSENTTGFTGRCQDYAKSRLSSVIIQKQMCAKLRTLPICGRENPDCSRSDRSKFGERKT